MFLGLLVVVDAYKVEKQIWLSKYTLPCLADKFQEKNWGNVVK